MSLFDDTSYIVSECHPDLRPELSADQRRTIRNREQLALNIHPATGLRVLAGWTFTCRDCVHSFRIDHNGRQWWKCERHRLGPSHSAASDIRVSWPACTLLTIAGKSDD